eukprot:Sdes_comp19194_c0_seq4m10044
MAYALGKDGRNVVVVERDLSEPDRIVGELLQPGGVRALKKLGLEDCFEGIDECKAHGYVAHYKGNQVELPYPFSEQGTDKFVQNGAITSEKEGDSCPELVRETGRSFHHGRFVMKLRKAAQSLKNVRIVEGTVFELIENSSSEIVGIRFRDRSEGDQVKEIRSPLTVVADGCFSKFRKLLVKSEPKCASNFVGILMENAELTSPNMADVVLANPSLVLAYRLCSKQTRVLVDIPGPLPSASSGALKSYLVDMVAPQVPQKWRKQFLTAVESQRLRSMPNSELHASPISKPGVLLLGDALNMRHPLTGGGMTVAFSDVVLWRDFLQTVADFHDKETIFRYYKQFQWDRQGCHAFVVNILAQALYAFFSAQDENFTILREACFDYFQLGGECKNGPVRLLSILTPDPLLLIRHFFLVSIFGVYNVLKKSSLSSFPFALLQCVKVWHSACKVIFPLIYLETYKVFTS